MEEGWEEEVNLKKMASHIIPLLNHFRSPVRMMERAVDEAADRVIPSIHLTARSEPVYEGRIPARIQVISGDDSDKDKLKNELRGRRVGFSFHGRKAHVIHEATYGKKRFLCGAIVDEEIPLRVVTTHTEVDELCTNCCKALLKGVV